MCSLMEKIFQKIQDEINIFPPFIFSFNIKFPLHSCCMGNSFPAAGPLWSCITVAALKIARALQLSSSETLNSASPLSLTQ